MNRIILASFLLTQVASAQNISQPADSVKHIVWYKTNAFKIGAVPAVLIGYSLTIMDNHGLYSSQNAYDYRQKHYPDFHTHVDDYLPAFPVVLLYGLDLAGIKSRNTAVNQAFIIGISQAVNELLVFPTKSLTGIDRPDNSNNDSYPSGHTSSAFAAAEVLHQEFKEKSIWISVAGYSAATSVGALRMLNNKHWLSDVVAGAGFGILSTKLTYLLYPKVQKKAVGY